MSRPPHVAPSHAQGKLAELLKAWRVVPAGTYGLMAEMAATSTVLVGG